MSDDTTPELPSYGWGQTPANFKTKKQLAEQGQRPGGAQVAWLTWGRRNDPKRAALFNADEAVAKRPATEAQLAALEKARVAKWQTICATCGQLTYVDEETGMCFACQERLANERDEQARAKAAKWAFNVMQYRTLILDTETTGLDDAYIVQIAVIDIEGNVLLDTLVNPGVPIPEEATAIHHITDEIVATAPTFAEIEPQLRELLNGRRVSVYNVDYDWSVLRHELQRLHNLPTGEHGWLNDVLWRDVMPRYSAWCGEWSEYHGNYRLQPLGGGHTALSDCQATLEILKHMAGDHIRRLDAQEGKEE